MSEATIQRERGTEGERGREGETGEGRRSPLTGGRRADDGGLHLLERREILLLHKRRGAGLLLLHEPRGRGLPPPRAAAARASSSTDRLEAAAKGIDRAGDGDERV